MSLEHRAELWIAPYWNARHLVRARDWALELEAGAPEAVRIAALTHDIERHFPGGPENDLSRPPDDPAYREAHARRSAEIVGAWLRDLAANAGLVREVEVLVTLHEVGGTPAADLVQAADSLSFLEVNAELVERWVREERCSRARGVAQLEWMYERMKLERARDLGRPLLEAAVARL